MKERVFQYIKVASLIILVAACQGNKDSATPHSSPTATKSFSIHDEGFQSVDFSTLRTHSYEELISEDNYLQNTTFSNYEYNFLKFSLLHPESLSSLKWRLGNQTTLPPLKVAPVHITFSRSEATSCKATEIFQKAAQEASHITGIKKDSTNWESRLTHIGDGSFNCAFALHNETTPEKITKEFLQNNTIRVIKVRKNLSSEEDISNLKHDLLANHLIKKLAPLAFFVRKTNTGDIEDRLLEVNEISYTPQSLGQGATTQKYVNGISLKRIEYAINHFSDRSTCDELDPNTGKRLSSEEAITRIFGFASVQDAYERVMALHDFYYASDALAQKYLTDNQVNLYNSIINTHRSIGLDNNQNNIFWIPSNKIFVAVDF